MISNEKIAVLCAIGEGTLLRGDQMREVAQLLADDMIEPTGNAAPEQFKLTGRGQEILNERGAGLNEA